MSGKDRIVFKKGDQWANKKLENDRSSSLHKTQNEAEAAARDMLRREGGGELITKGENGRIRSKDTIAPGNESAVRDTEH